MTREQAITFLTTKPYKFGHMFGFDKLSTLHNEWIISMLRSKQDHTLQAHRGSYKTTCVSIALALICILLPKKRTIFLRKTENDIVEVIRQVEKILLDPHTQYFVNCIYGVDLKLKRQTNSEIATNLITDFKGASQLVGTGLNGSLTGKHFDYIFTDDIVNLSDRISKAEREHTKYVYQELQNIKNQGGRLFNTGTPWHKDDCFTLMSAPMKYDCYSTGLMTEQDIADLRSHMSPSLFAANYELKHIADENVIFFEPQLGGNPAMAEQGICHVDSAFYGEDWTALTIAKIQGDKVYMFGQAWRKHVEDCYADILTLYNRFKCGKLYMEKNSDKGMVARDLRKIGINAVSYNEGMNKHVKIVTYLKALWNDIIFVDGTSNDYLEQICDYTEDATHDDAPDSAASVARILYPKIGKAEYIPLYN